VGFAPATFITCSALNTLYQFWIHTRLIGKLGPIEWVFNTPSHHRVHHGRNPRYIDRNHAGVFIIWDRIFGTFVPETDEPVYGVVKPLASTNPVWANVAGWADLCTVATKSRRWKDRLRPFLAAPGWRPIELGGPLSPPEVSRPADEVRVLPIPRSLVSYVFVHFVLLLVLGASALARIQAVGVAGFSAIALLVTLSFVVLSTLIERRPWGRPLEAARVLLLLFLGIGYGPALVAALFLNS
jgi:hypothetical protein